MSDNEIYLLIKYIKSVLWRVAKCLSYIEEARCLKVNVERSWKEGTEASRFRLEVAPPLRVKRVTALFNLFGKDF